MPKEMLRKEAQTQLPGAVYGDGALAHWSGIIDLSSTVSSTVPDRRSWSARVRMTAAPTRTR